MNYHNVSKLLFKRFPELKDKILLKEINYGVFGEFAEIIDEGISFKELDEVRLSQYYEFLNEIGESKDDQLINLLEVAVFEGLICSYYTINASKKYLKGNALILYEKVLNIYVK